MGNLKENRGSSRLTQVCHGDKRAPVQFLDKELRKTADCLPLILFPLKGVEGDRFEMKGTVASNFSDLVWEEESDKRMGRG